MGTRNLTMVISDGETKVAQYGQWDGYPAGQGATILAFIKKVSVKRFKEVLKKVKFIDDKKQKEIDKWFISIGCESGWMNGDQAELYRKKYPLLTRDNGAQVLFLLMELSDKTLWLSDQTDFAGDSLFCEWAYVLDLDKRVLEVYNGFNKEPISSESRFAKISKGDSEYSQVQLLVKYTFAELKKMSKDDFVTQTEKLEKVEE